MKKPSDRHIYVDDNRKSMAAQPLRILLVEDNSGDAGLTQELLQDTGIPTSIDMVKDGEEAIEVLMEAIDDDHSLPDLVLLDLNLPKKSGHEVLEFIRESDEIARICVIIYSGSASPDDMRRSQENGANGYLVKPMNIEEMEATTRKFRDLLTSAEVGPCFPLQRQVI